MGDYGAEIPGRARNWASQIWPIAHEIKIGDWIVLPSKMKASVHIGEITGEYVFDKKQEDPYFHYRAVRWFATDIPRVNFDQDILYSFGVFMTVCRISRNDAENRIREMGKNKWMPKEGIEIHRLQDIEDELQVKTTDAQVDRPILDQLIGTMHNYKADHEIPSQFFNVRLWDQKEIINELLENYEKLDDEIKAEIPLKRIWTLTFPDRE